MRLPAVDNKDWRLLVFAALLTLSMSAYPGPFAGPGDLRLRHDLQLLDDAGFIDKPLTTWPLAWGDLADALDDVESEALSLHEQLAYDRLRQAASQAMGNGRPEFRVGASIAGKPRVIRGFEDTPRENAEFLAGFQWTGNRLAFNATARVTDNSFDGDTLRPDDSFVGVALGNWMLTAGWQQRWWGPGHDGNLILSNNARPVPAVALQRNRSTPSDQRWLRWLGPWTISTFMGLLDDERVIDDALLFGVRAAFRPHRSLEVGLTRTAQWCGDDRPCGNSAFVDLLLGNDNRGVNVGEVDEPGNQLAGIDVRWLLSAGVPAAVYLQWVGEDSRRGGPEIGSWLRQIGIETFSHWGSIDYRLHLEVSETSCRDGGIGFSDLVPNCAYEHAIYRSGYRYKGRSLGHGMDGDGLAYSLGSTLVQSGGSTWNVGLRFMEINRVGSPNARHTLSPTPQDRFDVQISNIQEMAWGRIHTGVGYNRIDWAEANDNETDVTVFIQWNSW